MPKNQDKLDVLEEYPEARCIREGKLYRVHLGPGKAPFVSGLSVSEAWKHAAWKLTYAAFEPDYPSEE